MNPLLDEAIEQLRELPEEEQEAAADMLFAYIASEERQYRLDPRHADEVQTIRRNRATRFDVLQQERLRNRMLCSARRPQQAKPVSWIE